MEKLCLAEGAGASRRRLGGRLGAAASACWVSAAAQARRRTSSGVPWAALFFLLFAFVCHVFFETCMAMDPKVSCPAPFFAFSRPSRMIKIFPPACDKKRTTNGLCQAICCCAAFAGQFAAVRPLPCGSQENAQKAFAVRFCFSGAWQIPYFRY